ncbi:hypothetical protein MM221_08830 [Salipaludibacillus sp. LMS25]|jgi:hypothetical protein|uniref:hypothetical protein n=1 Tax=Salipaludibacillus sp. LMS25 TaxID=2924031 RepID=UPI0020D0806C|nr:hypothetical protein [Salipaludibacillus sp. LMS25]UTR16612.1 hypothetical protein MM221_08830 [Salipaludibacillus sp. LMS25]
MLSWLVASVPPTYTPHFHPEGHMKMWYTSPFNRFEPHLMTAILAIIIIAGMCFTIHFRSKAKTTKETWEKTADERVFQQLMRKKKMTLNKLLEIDTLYHEGKITEAEYELKSRQYRHYLYEIKIKLNDFMT